MGIRHRQAASFYHAITHVIYDVIHHVICHTTTHAVKHIVKDAVTHAHRHHRRHTIAKYRKATDMDMEKMAAREEAGYIGVVCEAKEVSL